ncbi:MAG: hypothetical protein F6K40_00920 [Okeania sp. SIO3I5]|uniref:HalD/BesD family halogenase n=1 Tax=Okeania sp. SIO3I5 TaxID=2607805 RepID=UPI0013BE659F|nr:hypothetical protein [Okeania sp. SIO3I5]NEQ34946.1 hypothetical protein [Okeania sp. SIO3I5]
MNLETYTQNEINFVNDHYQDNLLKELSQKFKKDGYVKLKNFIRLKPYQLIMEEISILEQIATHKNFTMKPYNTPRQLSVIGGSQIVNNSPFLLSLYYSSEVRSVLTKIVDEKIVECRHPEEFMVINFLLNKRSTHGWHLDDPPYALIIFIESPSCYSDGGLLEFISDWKDFCKRNDFHPYKDIEQAVKKAKKLGYVHQHWHEKQDAYILRADKNLHRALT